MVALLAGCAVSTGETGSDDGVELIETDNALRIEVAWQTAEPATSRVEFCEGDGCEPAWSIEDAALVTDHVVTVYGLHAGTRGRMWAASTTEGGEAWRSAPAEFETGPLPYDIDVAVDSSPDAELPWVLTTLVAEGETEEYSVPVAVAIDDTGVVWYEPLGDGGGPDVVIREAEGGVAVGGGVAPGEAPRIIDWDGDVRSAGRPQPDNRLETGGLHHDFHVLDDGRFVVLELEYGDDETPGNRIAVYDPSGGLSAPDEWNWLYIPADGVVWGNVAAFDPALGLAWYHDANQRVLVAVDIESREILWTFGSGRDFAIVGDSERLWPSGNSHGHTLFDEADGLHLLVFDNGSEDESSRVIEYLLDPAEWTAEIVWTYDADDTLKGSGWGSVQRLADGHTLYALAGMKPGDSASEIVELDEDSATTWRASLTSESGRAGCYQATRMTALALAPPQ